MTTFEPLTWNADTADFGAGSYATRFGCKWQNFLSASGWQAIDLTPRQSGGEWVIDKAPYGLALPNAANGWATVESTVRYNIHTRTTMPDAKCGILKRYPSALPVTAVPQANGSIFFPLCFPDLGPASRMVQPHEQKLRDWVVFHVEPPGDGEVLVPIEIDCGDLPIHRCTGRYGRSAPQEFAREPKDINLPFGLSFSNGGARGMRIKPPVARDSAGRSIFIKLRGKVIGTRFVGWKVIPRSFFAKATYPVFADTTSTFYPDPDPETTSVDGYVFYDCPAPGEFFVQVRGASGYGSTGADAGSGIFARLLASATVNNQYLTMIRGVTVFDTSAIPDADAILSGSVSLWVDAVSSDNGNQSIALCAGTTASSTALAAGDYTGNVNNTTELATSVDLTGIAAGGYLTMALNASGLANLSKTGVSKFSQRLSGDRANQNPALNATEDALISILSAEDSGTTHDPKLTVVHGTDEAGRGRYFMEYPYRSIPRAVSY